MVTQGARDGRERNETGLTQAAAATGPTQAATATWKGQQVHMLLCFVIVSLLSSFLHLTLLLFRSLLFRQVQQQAGNERKVPAGRTRRDIRGRRYQHGTTRRGQTGQPGTSSFVFLSFLLSSFILIILLLFRLSLFQWSITTGRQDGADGNTGRDGGGRQAR